MTEQRHQAAPTAIMKIGILLLGLALLAVLLLPPVKGWLNRIPHFWDVLYPLLTLFAGYVFISAIVAREGVLSVVTWGLLLTSTLCATIFTYGGAHAFFTVGRWSALLFIAAQVVDTLVDVVSGPASEAA